MSILLTNVNLVPMTDEVILRDTCISVKDGKIQAIGETCGTPTETIDCGGGYLLPGFCDMHVHLEARGDDGSYVSGTSRLAPVTNTKFNEFLKMYIAHGVTLVRNMSGCPEILRLCQKVENREVLGPHIITTSPIIEGLPPSGPGRMLLPDAETARAVVRQIKETGYHAVKIYNNITPDIFDAIMDEADKLGIKVCGHVPVPTGIDRVLESKMWTYEHVRALPKRVLKEAGQAHKVMTPTLVIEKCDPLYFKNKDAYDKELERAESRCVSYEQLTQWRELQQIVFEHDFRQDRPYEEYRADVKAFLDYGGVVLSGTDSGFPFNVGGESLAFELIELTIGGLTEFESLCTTTVWPGKVLGIAHKRGTLEKGKDADLVLLGGNPLEDIYQVQNVKSVMFAGKWFDEKALHGLKKEAMSAAVRK